MNTADKLLSVLRLYSVQQPEWSVEEAATEIGISISTAYRYFRSLCKIGLLEPHQANGYILGPTFVEYDRQIRINDPLINVGKPIMKRLLTHSDGIGIALLCRIHRNCVMCIHQEGELSAALPISYERGRLMPMFRGSSSKVIFANLPSASVRWFFRKFPEDIAEAGLGSDWETVKANLRQIRKSGVVVARGEVDKNRVGIAAPVFGSQRKVLGSISLVIAANDATPERIFNLSALVDSAGKQIHAGLLNSLNPVTGGKAAANPFDEATEERVKA